MTNYGIRINEGFELLTIIINKITQIKSKNYLSTYNRISLHCDIQTHEKYIIFVLLSLYENQCAICFDSNLSISEI